MTQERKRPRIVRAIAEQLGIDENIVTPEKSLTKDLGMDSLDDIELVMTIEDEFDIEIADEEAEACETVQHVFDLVAKRARP